MLTETQAQREVSFHQRRMSGWLRWDLEQGRYNKISRPFDLVIHQTESVPLVPNLRVVDYSVRNDLGLFGNRSILAVVRKRGKGEMSPWVMPLIEDIAGVDEELERWGIEDVQLKYNPRTILRLDPNEGWRPLPLKRPEKPEPGIKYEQACVVITTRRLNARYIHSDFKIEHQLKYIDADQFGRLTVTLPLDHYPQLKKLEPRTQNLGNQPQP